MIDEAVVDNIPFLEGGISGYVDNYYYFSWSGDKFISPMVEKTLKMFDELEDWVEHLANMFWVLHGEQLLRQWENFTVEYDATKPYRTTETLDYKHDGTVNSSGNNVRTGANVRTGTVTESDSAWAYDMASSSPGKRTGETVTDYGSGLRDEYENVTDTNTSGSADHAEDDLTTIKEGNLGTISMSKLVEDDIKLRRMNFYKTILFPALDSFLAIPIY